MNVKPVLMSAAALTLSIALASCNLNQTEVEALPTEIALPGILELVPTTAVSNEILATKMEAARSELEGINGFYRTEGGFLEVKNESELSDLAQALAEYGKEVVSKKVKSGTYTLDDNLNLISTQVSPRISVFHGRWWAGVWINFVFSSDEARAISYATGALARDLAIFSAIPYATAVRVVSGFVSFAFTACNWKNTGVVVDAGTYYVAPYIYCRPR